MAQRSLPQAGSGVGDAGPYTDDEWAEYFRYTYTGDQYATQGPLKAVLNELRVTSPAALTIRIHTGVGFCYGRWMINDAINDITVAAAAASRPDRVIICQNDTNANYNGTADYGAACVTPVVPRNSTRLAVLYGVEPATQRPLMAGPNAYMVEIGSYTMTGATIGPITDSRDFCQFGTEVVTEMIADNAVTAAKIPNRTRYLFVPVTGGRNLTDSTSITPYLIEGMVLESDKHCTGVGRFAVPADYSSSMTVRAVVVSSQGTPGNIYARDLIEYGACSESHSMHTADSGFSVVAINATPTVDCILSLNLAQASAGDIVDCLFARNALDASDTVTEIVAFKGWLVTYTADY